MINHL